MLQACQTQLLVVIVISGHKYDEVYFFFVLIVLSYLSTFLLP
jgi:hypothetical protein